MSRRVVVLLVTLVALGAVVGLFVAVRPSQAQGNPSVVSASGDVLASTGVIAFDTISTTATLSDVTGVDTYMKFENIGSEEVLGIGWCVSYPLDACSNVAVSMFDDGSWIPMMPWTYTCTEESMGILVFFDEPMQPLEGVELQSHFDVEDFADSSGGDPSFVWDADINWGTPVSEFTATVDFGAPVFMYNMVPVPTAKGETWVQWYKHNWDGENFEVSGSFTYEFSNVYLPLIQKED